MAESEIQDVRRAQPRLVGRFLEPHLHVLGTDRKPCPARRDGDPRVKLRLEALLQRADDGLYQRRDQNRKAVQQ